MREWIGPDDFLKFSGWSHKRERRQSRKNTHDRAIQKFVSTKERTLQSKYSEKSWMRHFFFQFWRFRLCFRRKIEKIYSFMRCLQNFAERLELIGLGLLQNFQIRYSEIFIWVSFTRNRCRTMSVSLLFSRRFGWLLVNHDFGYLRGWTMKRSGLLGTRFSGRQVFCEELKIYPRPSVLWWHQVCVPKPAYWTSIYEYFNGKFMFCGQNHGEIRDDQREGGRSRCPPSPHPSLVIRRLRVE